MVINFYQKGLKLSDSQEDYITSKLESLNKFKVIEDPSVSARVDVEFMEHIASDHKYQMAVTINVPQAVLRAETDAISVGEGIDLIEEKLRAQLEKYKTVRK